MDTTTPTYTAAKYVCVGHHFAGRRMHVSAMFRRLDWTQRDGMAEEVMLWPFDGITAGTIYEIETTPEGRARPPQFLRPWHDRDQAAEWQAISKAARVDLERARAEAKAKRDDPILEALDPLRRAYARMPFYQRRGFELVVLDYLRRPLKD